MRCGAGTPRPRWSPGTGHSHSRPRTGSQRADTAAVVAAHSAGSSPVGGDYPAPSEEHRGRVPAGHQTGVPGCASSSSPTRRPPALPVTVHSSGRSPNPSNRACGAATHSTNRTTSRPPFDHRPSCPTVRGRSLSPVPGVGEAANAGSGILRGGVCRLGQLLENRL